MKYFRHCEERGTFPPAFSRSEATWQSMGGYGVLNISISDGPPRLLRSLAETKLAHHDVLPRHSEERSDVAIHYSSPPAQQAF